MDPSDRTMSFIGRMKLYINKTTNVWMRPFAAAAHLFVRSMSCWNKRGTEKTRLRNGTATTRPRMKQEYFGRVSKMTVFGAVVVVVVVVVAWLSLDVSS